MELERTIHRSRDQPCAGGIHGRRRYSSVVGLDYHFMRHREFVFLLFIVIVVVIFIVFTLVAM